MSREFKNVLVALVPQGGDVKNPTPAMEMGLAIAKEAEAVVTVMFLSPEPA